MKYGIREICDVTLRAKSAMKIGKKVFYPHEPVIMFDTLSTSSMEGAATTVYAQGGRGNPRLIAWEGERTVTFTMEDALISPEGLMILTGAGLIEADEANTIKQHVTETIDAKAKINLEDGGLTSRVSAENGEMKILLSKMPYIPADESGDYAFIMLIKNGEIVSEPYIPEHVELNDDDKVVIEAKSDVDGKDYFEIVLKSARPTNHKEVEDENPEHQGNYVIDPAIGGETFPDFDSILVDYYVEHASHAKQIEITPDKFGGNYYLEASTLWRDTNGADLPAEFIIPNCKIQSNFNFNMSASGDPSTFTFTMDAFPDFTRFDRSKKVLSVIQIIDSAASMNLHRHQTVHEEGHNKYFD